MTPRELMQARIRYIMRLMTTGGFHDPKGTCAELASEWDLHPGYVHKCFAEASRRVEGAAGDVELVRQTLFGRLETISAACVGAGDTRNAIKALELQMKAHGLLVDRHMNVPAAERHTPRELRAKLLAALAEVDAEIENGAGDVLKDHDSPAIVECPQPAQENADLGAQSDATSEKIADS